MSEHKQDLSALYIPGAIVIAGLIIGVSIVFAFSGAGSLGGGGGTKTVAVNIDDVDLKGEPYIGEANAPVAIAYWSDFQCPYCKAVEMGHPQIPTEPALPRIISEYVDKGLVRVVFKDYAFLGPDSTIAALYQNAVWEMNPNKYWEWHEAMFEAQDEENAGFGNEESILALIRGISGLDAGALKARVEAKRTEYMAENDADREEGTAMGVSGTPGFIIGTTLIPGAAEFSKFQTAIEAEL
ncbi:MAG TPA: thioredoxin domain-containing protein [Candidatus Paceibacterota bacterium]